MDDRLHRNQLVPLLLVVVVSLVVAAATIVMAGSSYSRPPGGATSPSAVAMTASSPSFTGDMIIGTITEVRIGDHDGITVVVAGRSLRLVADTARIVVPEGSIHVVGTVRDLGVGQRVTIGLERGAAPVDGAAAASITVGAVHRTDVSGG